MPRSTGIKRFAGMLMVGLFATLATSAQSDSVVTPGSKAAGMDACVAPTAEMRRYHMEYLKHDRVETVRQGVRGLKNSLADCVDCHSAKDGNGDYLSINADGQFCDRCHNYMAVTLACFQCHRKTPADQDASSAGTDTGNQGHAFGLLLGQGESATLTAEERAQFQALVREE